ncbi:MAG: ATP-binding protein [Bacteroidales bacterium]|nr:ATP-binding protein [Bacteroidales bacterium]
MNRDILQQLVTWKDNPRSKPLILQGARQVGKTYVLKQFGQSFFDSTAYFNFEKQPGLKQFFADTKEPREIIDSLTLVNAGPIHPQRTLIIFDEIQECNDALNALKYFNEEAPEYKVACAGSLLGVAMARGASFPVGKVDFMNLHPLSFAEFLAAADSPLFAYLDSLEKIEAIPDIFFNPLKEKLKMYFISGGMPEAVIALLELRDVGATQEALQNILNAYRLDFSKHVENKDIQKIFHIWDSVPSQLARENKKFLYQTIKTGARAREYKDALNWLINAGLVCKIHASSKPALPLSAYDDLSSFKVYLQDVGLLRRLSQLDPTVYGEGNRLLTEFKGMLSENFILSGLLRQFEGLPRYWRSGNLAEVDFLIQHQNKIIPVEVKSDENIKSRSLIAYRQNFSPELSLRFSLRNLRKEEGFINLPLFMVDYTSKFIGLY